MQRKPPIRAEPVPTRILEAAIKLFGLHSYSGVSMQHLCQEARVQPPAVYLWFKNKEDLYLEAVNTVVERRNAEFHDFLVKLHQEVPTPSEIIEHVERWIEGIPELDARLLMQVYKNDIRRAKMVATAFEMIIGAVASAFKDQKTSEAQEEARDLVHSLFWSKVLEQPKGRKEMRGTVTRWTLRLSQ